LLSFIHKRFPHAYKIKEEKKRKSTQKKKKNYKATSNRSDVVCERKEKQKPKRERERKEKSSD